MPSPATSGCALPFRRQPSKRGQPIRTSRTNRPDPGPIAEGTNAITSDAFSSHSPDVDLNSNVSSLHARAPLPTAWLATDEAVARLIGPRPIDPSIQDDQANQPIPVFDRAPGCPRIDVERPAVLLLPIILARSSRDDGNTSHIERNRDECTRTRSSFAKK
ncbi:hypothetical protein HN011_007486 [Eciton burchellii]|nr:hypothetical protein HN011_007486 [Eciton burchellii]